MFTFFSESVWFFLLCIVLDLIFGDPVYVRHPIRIIGKLLLFWEKHLRLRGFTGIVGGILLFIFLTLSVFGGIYGLSFFLNWIHPALAYAWKLFIGYSLLSLKDLCTHGLRIAQATTSGNLEKAREAVSMLVGRDTDKMDLAACNRAAIESLSENLTDGVIAPLFYFALLGLPGLILFKIVSTMDSMVGYKNERYLYFGRFGARFDDVLNFIPARLTWLLITAYAACVRNCSAPKAWRIGLAQHALVPGPNAGWSETAAAAALQIKLAGPIWLQGQLVNTLWLGDAQDKEEVESLDVRRMIHMVYGVTGIFLVFVLSLI